MAKNLEGKNCPKFKADATSDQIVSNETFKNQNIIIYFYPKDSTPGCTTEGQEFRDSYNEFNRLFLEQNDTLSGYICGFISDIYLNNIELALNGNTKTKHPEVLE